MLDASRPTACPTCRSSRWIRLPPRPPGAGGAGVVATATRLGVTPAQVALAWLLQRSPNVLLIPGTSSLEHLRENLAAADLALDDLALDQIG